MDQTTVQRVDELIQEAQQRFANVPTTTDAGAMLQLSGYVSGIHQAVRAIAEEVDALRAQG
jgi:hypothetical protein